MKENIYHLINGLWSGIPLCCITFFVANHAKHEGGIAAAKYKERYNREFEIDPEKNISKADYVRCDKCWNKDRLAKVRDNGVIMYWMIKD